MNENKLASVKEWNLSVGERVKREVNRIRVEGKCKVNRYQKVLRWAGSCLSNRSVLVVLLLALTVHTLNITTLISILGVCTSRVTPVQPKN